MESAIHVYEIRPRKDKRGFDQPQKIKPLIAQRFPFAEARQAHELLGNGGITGKIVIVQNGPFSTSPII
jgi:hypothetical protein